MTNKRTRSGALRALRRADAYRASLLVGTPLAALASVALVGAMTLAPTPVSAQSVGGTGGAGAAGDRWAPGGPRSRSGE
jgi:hypothetical protein